LVHTKTTRLQYIRAFERLERFSHVAELEMTQTFAVAELPVVEPHLLRLRVHVDGETVLAQQVVALICK
jgi:hypothetical protein